MARWDEVTLYGQLAEAPLAYRAQQTEDGELLRVIAKLTVLRGIRKFGAYDQRQKLDVLSVMSGVEKDMKEMAWMTIMIPHRTLQNDTGSRSRPYPDSWPRDILTRTSNRENTGR